MFFHESGAGAAWIVEVSERNHCLQERCSVGKWRHCTFPHSVRRSPFPRNRQMITLLSRTKGPSRVDTTVSEL